MSITEIVNGSLGILAGVVVLVIFHLVIIWLEKK